MPEYTIDTETWRSPNYDGRTKPISSIVVHSCEGALPVPRLTSLPYLCNPQPLHPEKRVSAHYYVCRDTTIFQLVDDEHEAWHVGVAEAPFVNNVSLGIECEHHKGQGWPSVQLDALAWLLQRLSSRYAIPARLIETHGQVAIRGPYQRKSDPTNWPHDDFVWFVGRTIASQPRIVHAGPYGAIARTDYQATAKAAAYYGPGNRIEIDSFHTNGYRHSLSGIGFIADGDLVL